MSWKTLLAHITGTVDQDLLLRNEYLVTENRILRHQITGRMRLTDGERKTLAEIGQKLGKQALAEVATIVKPDTILAWYRTLVAQKFDRSQRRKAPGRPKIDPELEALIVRMAQENRSWGYDRIVGGSGQPGTHRERPDRGQHPEAAWPAPSAKAQDHHHVDRVHPHASGRVGGDRLLHRRGVDVGGTGDVLRPVLYPAGHKGRTCGRGNSASHRAVDDADGAQPHHGGVGVPLSWAVPHP
jgi:hypothetical protein